MDIVTTTGDIDILEVESDSDLSRFIELPFDLYRDDPNWVPPLISERKAFFNRKTNPFFRAAKIRLLLARRKGQYVGRIATCVNFQHNEYHQETTGFFGFFDVINDYAVAEVLLKVAMIKLKAEGMTQMVGPASFSTNQEVGMLIEGYDSPPVVMMTYNKPYYNDFVERFGLKKMKDLLAFKIVDTDSFDPRVVRIAERIRARENVRIRTLQMKDFAGEVARLLKVYNLAWSRNWGFVPMTEDEFRHLARDMKQIVDPHMVFIAEVEGQPVGFCLSLPNINQALKYINGRLFPTGLLKLLWHTKIKNKINSVRIITMGIIPEYQKRGIDTLFYVETFKVGPTRAYTWGEMSWILEDNYPMVRAAELMGAKVYKKYRVYGMRL